MGKAAAAKNTNTHSKSYLGDIHKAQKELNKADSVLKIKSAKKAAKKNKKTLEALVNRGKTHKKATKGNAVGGCSGTGCKKKAAEKKATGLMLWMRSFMS